MSFIFRKVPEEDCEWRGNPLNDDPRHESVEVCLHQAGLDLLDLKREYDPLSQVEEEEENGHLTTRLAFSLAQRKYL